MNYQEKGALNMVALILQNITYGVELLDDALVLKQKIIIDTEVGASKYVKNGKKVSKLFIPTLVAVPQMSIR